MGLPAVRWDTNWVNIVSVNRIKSVVHLYNNKRAFISYTYAEVLTKQSTDVSRQCPDEAMSSSV